MPSPIKTHLSAVKKKKEKKKHQILLPPLPLLLAFSALRHHILHAICKANDFFFCRGWCISSSFHHQSGSQCIHDISYKLMNERNQLFCCCNSLTFFELASNYMEMHTNTVFLFSSKPKNKTCKTNIHSCSLLFGADNNRKIKNKKICQET